MLRPSKAVAATFRQASVSHKRSPRERAARSGGRPEQGLSTVDAAAPAHAGSALRADSAGHQFEECVLGRKRRPGARPLLHRWHRRDGGHAVGAGVDLVGYFRLSPSLSYAEIAGLFPNKSGGASVYSAAAWVRYSEVRRAAFGPVQLARLDPVLAIGCGITAG